MKALVTGATGFLGLYVVEQLVSRGDQVRAFCRQPTNELEKLSVEIARGDIRDRSAVGGEAIEALFAPDHRAELRDEYALDGAWKRPHFIDAGRSVGG